MGTPHGVRGASKRIGSVPSSLSPAPHRRPVDRTETMIMDERTRQGAERFHYAQAAGRAAGQATEYNPDIFSFRRITLAPIVCLIGFLLVIVGIMYRPKEKE